MTLRSDSSLDVGESIDLSVSGNKQQNQMSVTQTHAGGRTYQVTQLYDSASIHLLTMTDPRVEMHEPVRSEDRVSFHVGVSMDVSEMEPHAILDRFSLSALLSDELEEIGAHGLIAASELSPEQEMRAYRTTSITVSGTELDTSHLGFEWALAHDVMSDKIREELQQRCSRSKQLSLITNAEQIVEEENLSTEVTL